MGWTTEVQLLAEAIMGFFLFTTTSRPAIGPTQPPIQWIPGTLTPEVGVKQQGYEADHILPTSAKVKNLLNYTSTSPVHLHGMVLS